MFLTEENERMINIILSPHLKQDKFRELVKNYTSGVEESPADSTRALAMMFPDNVRKIGEKPKEKKKRKKINGNS